MVGKLAIYSNRQQRLKQQESLSEYKCDKCEVSGGYHILTGLQDTSKTYNDHSQYKPNVKVCLYMYNGYQDIITLCLLLYHNQ